MEQECKNIIDAAERIIVMQADNPDADSLGSALALEHILGDMGKQVWLYCGVNIPGYLQYLDGWDRVTSELPEKFDASVIVDASTLTLFERLQTAGQMSWIAAKPSIVLDHHLTVQNQLSFATVLLCNPKASSTGEVIYNLAKKLDWTVSIDAGANLATAILGDTQGLSNDLAQPDTYRVMAELLELGVNRPHLEERRRELGKMPEAIFRYKAKLLEHTEFTAGGRIASVDVPQGEITTYSPLYNPVPLIQNDMLGTKGVALGIVFKRYDDGRITGAIRCNSGFGIANKIAEHLGGGGHPYASGFKIVHGRPFNEVKSECLAFATELLDNLDKEHTDETLQHAHGEN
jgi:phosphoesterase RecJ-like protein